MILLVYKALINSTYVPILPIMSTNNEFSQVIKY